MWQLISDDFRHQREVKILDKYDRIVGLRFFQHCQGEPLVNILILLPIGGSKDGTHVSEMTQGPDAFIGESVVVAILFLGCYPDPPEVERRMLRGNPDVAAGIDDLAVRCSTPVGDPHT